MVWNKTPAKLREVKEGGGFADGAEAAIGEDGEPVAAEGGEVPIPEESKDDSIIVQPLAAVAQDDKPKRYAQVPYSEEDFRQRIPSEEYLEIKRIEDEVLAFKKENVRIYVLASGIMYGAGESILENHFKRAWL